MQAGRRVRFTLRVFDGAGRKAERGGERVSGTFPSYHPYAHKSTEISSTTSRIEPLRHRSSYTPPAYLVPTSTYLPPIYIPFTGPPPLAH
eukprot:scaffold16455_cov33-Phaeocystis_antarctica.AAC.2